MTADWLTGVLKPGDLVVVAQGTGEPTPLLEQLVRAAPADVEVFVGLSHSSALTGPAARELPLVSFGALGPLGRLAVNGTVSVIPCHFRDVPRALASRNPEQIVVALQVSSADDTGHHSLGLAVDYTYELLGRARAVVAEVNDRLPHTSAPRVHRSVLTTTVASSRPMPTITAGATGPVHERIARHVAGLVPDGATIQLGVGTLPSAIGAALRSRRDLRVHSTLAGTWLLDLARAGALRDEPGAVVICEAAGSQELYDWVVGSGVLVRPVSELARPGAFTDLDHFVAMNSALQVDLTGQVNAEELGSGYVGGIGGQPDYLRAAQHSRDGLSVVMLPATTGDGSRSRIVRCLHAGAVTTPRSHVDVVVTEHGIADLRGRSLTERAEALVAIAAPGHRSSLRETP
ncbi:acetyl-CoA hydrolase/transferase C-terminal domain-containing protein [Amycolatopsis rhabdoformis]|uniref:Acetyl-CoA hydrolase/transferase C-terminal domain-containing protein n=1 Tax=Amycolatopsis rhabdoformis TaxID=1448059 RepID=A0ABZ1IJ74_9PSEU|nr:acetyl-CoA hydrolase/transferase C-terminal domain-containing protein [Amycolatopsis rhabdoformis]WSE34500.1 acetyl-CoA hydrolase/transferase C-terminal domain-containing protein [Amycolatopsis rhabdoformis]